MALKFDDIFAGRARRAVETQDQCLVEQLAHRMTQLAHRRRPGSGSDPAIALAAACAPGPLIRITEIAAGGRPLDSAKIGVAIGLS